MEREKRRGVEKWEGKKREVKGRKGERKGREGEE